MSQTTLWNGDSQEELKKIGSNSIDLTVTSPPYDDLRSYNGSNDQWGEHVWKNVLKELYRVTADGGIVVWIVADATIDGSETGTSFKQALHAIDCGFNLYDTMIWDKTSPQVPTESRYYDVFEYMFIFSKGKPKTLNLIADRRNRSEGSVSFKEKRSSSEERVMTKVKRVVKKFSRRFNIWNIRREMNKTKHPAVFPLTIAQDHITSWSNEGDTVLDPFMGSGTVGVACKLSNRKFIGIEIGKIYFDDAKPRIERINKLGI